VTSLQAKHNTILFGKRSTASTTSVKCSEEEKINAVSDNLSMILAPHK
jgi:hypothetical protein